MGSAGACGRGLELLAGAHGTVLNVPRMASRLALTRSAVRACLRRLQAERRLILLPRYPADGASFAEACKGYSREPFAGARAGRDRPTGLEWEGVVIAALVDAAPEGTQASYYRSAGGAEIDLVLRFPDRHENWAFEIKLRAGARLRRPFHQARAELKPKRVFLVHAGSRRFEVMKGVEAIGLEEAASLVKTRARC